MRQTVFIIMILLYDSHFVANVRTGARCGSVEQIHRRLVRAHPVVCLVQWSLDHRPPVELRLEGLNDGPCGSPVRRPGPVMSAPSAAMTTGPLRPNTLFPRVKELTTSLL